MKEGAENKIGVNVPDEGDSRSVAASDVQTVLPSRRATGASFHRPAFDRWGDTSHRRGIEIIHTPGHCAGHVVLL